MRPHVASWRWVFYVKVPIGLVALLLATRLVAAPARPLPRDLLPIGSRSPNLHVALECAECSAWVE
jgi:hypothetical protein